MNLTTKLGRNPEVHIHCAFTLVKSQYNPEVKEKWKDQEHELKQLATRFPDLKFGKIRRDEIDKIFQELHHQCLVELRKVGALKSGD